MPVPSGAARWGSFASGCGRAIAAGAVLLAGPLAIPVVLGRARHPRQQVRGRRRHPARALPLRAAVVAGRPPPAAAHLAARAPHRSAIWLGAKIPRDRRYNRPFRRSATEPGDRLWRDDQLYDFVVELDHNTRPRVAGRGSAVFVHVARPNRSPTAGCVALGLNDLRRLLAGLGTKTRIEIQS